MTSNYTAITPILRPEDYDLPLAGEFRLQFTFSHEGEISPDIHALSPTYQPLPSTTQFLQTSFEPLLHDICRDRREELHSQWQEAAEEAAASI